MNLKRRLRKWQKRLGLQDWDLTIEKENKLNRLAEVTTWPSRRQGIIRVNLAAKDDPHYHLDRVIVHELIHVYCRQMGVNKDNDLIEEQAVHAISMAITGFKKDKRFRRRSRKALLSD